MLVLVLLAIVWVVALAPTVVRKLREREAVTSVASFGSNLSRLSIGAPRFDHGRTAPGAPIGFSAAARRVAEQRGAGGLGDAGSLGFGTRNGGHIGVPGVEVGPLVSHVTTIRRRRVVAVLALSLVLSIPLGFAVSAFFYLTVLSVVALVTYLAALAYVHQLAIERAQKVVALETRREVAMALDEARHVRAGIPATPRPRVGGSGWSVPDEELSGLDLEPAELVTASR
ncbi:MAG TPA: hypothetical protein VKU92_09270 [Acidimicrobiales bacterium]|nr:hypothetical protein [Acidimicrobiales bacterium]